MALTMGDQEVLEYLGLPLTIRTLPEPDTCAIVERLKELTERVERLEATLIEIMAEGKTA